MNDLIEKAKFLLMPERARKPSLLDHLERVPEVLATAMAQQPIEEDSPLFI